MPMRMNLTFNLLFVFLFSAFQVHAQNTGIDKSAYYKALESGNLAAIDAQLSKVNAAPAVEKTAYEGTLLMKKAQLVSKSKDKLDLFKSGRSKLESCISKYKENTEYRFLRLIIQENAPKVVKYNTNLDEDSRLIQANFTRLSPHLQQVILDYSRKSKILKLSQAQFPTP